MKKKPSVARASPKQMPSTAIAPPRKKPRPDPGPPNNVLSHFFVLKSDHLSPGIHTEPKKPANEVRQKKAQEDLSKQEDNLKKAEKVFQQAQAKFKQAEAEFKESQIIFRKVQHATTEARRCVQALETEKVQARKAEKLSLDFSDAQGPTGPHKHSFDHCDVDNGGCVSFKMSVDFQRKAADQIQKDATDLAKSLHTNVSHEVEWFLADHPNGWKSFSSDSAARLFEDVQAEWDKLQFLINCLSTNITDTCENGVCEPITEDAADQQKLCFQKVFQRLASWLGHCQHEQKQVAAVLIRNGRSKVVRPDGNGPGLSVKPGEEEWEDPFEFCFHAIFYFKVAGAGGEVCRFDVSREMEGHIHG